VAELDVAPVEEFPPGAMKLIVAGAGLYVGVYNCAGDLYAIEDRCSHDDGPLCEGDWDEETCRVVCPRHGSAFDLATGMPRSLPAYEPVRTYPVRIVDGMVKVDVGNPG
jgi:3-phenylpropionate/trans-cinnamate dioxygenase ferredoxin subunit